MTACWMRSGLREAMTTLATVCEFQFDKNNSNLWTELNKLLCNAEPNAWAAAGDDIHLVGKKTGTEKSGRHFGSCLKHVAD